MNAGRTAWLFASLPRTIRTRRIANTSLISGSITRSPERSKNHGEIFGSATISATDTTRNTGSHAVGLMKMTDSAITVHMSVTKHALMISLPTRTVFRPVSTSTA